LRLEGTQVSVDYRSGALAKLLASFGNTELYSPEPAAKLWLAVRDVLPFAEPRDAAIWRLSVAPSRAASMVAAIKRRLAARAFYDWGGGLIWLAVTAEGDAGAQAVRNALAELAGKEAGQDNGHATLVRASDEMRRGIEVFQPLAEPLMQISRGIKASFDPDGIFNPGRMYAGI